MNTPTTLNDSVHEAMQELFPGLLAGTLAPAEAAACQQHLLTCQECRSELAWQRHLLQAEPALPAGLDMEAALARLMPQLGQDALPSGAVAPASKPAAAPRGSGWQAWLGWLEQYRWQRWALAAQFAAIVVLALRITPLAPPSYQALGHGAANLPDLLVVFQPQAQQEQIQPLLRRYGAQIVGGPTVTGAYMLEVAPEQQAALLATLQTDPAVASAAALTAAGQQP